MPTTCTFCGTVDPPSATVIKGRLYCQFCAASPYVVAALPGVHPTTFCLIVAHQSRTANLLLKQTLAAIPTDRSYDPLNESTDYLTSETSPLDFIVQAWASNGAIGLPAFIRRRIEDEHGQAALSIARAIRAMLRRDIPNLRLFTWEKFEL